MTLLLVHPNANPAEMTREIGLAPLRAWRCGEPRLTPRGTRLEGVWRDSRWSHGFELGKDATVESAITHALDTLATARRYLASLRATGGTAELIIGLPGDTYQGTSIGLERLQALAALGVRLGIEVFPKMNE